jgi:hypothetical protein
MANVIPFAIITLSAPTSGRANAARSGPSVRPSVVTLPKSEVAAESRSLLTSDGSAARIEGENSAVPKPASTASARVAGKVVTRPSPMNATARMTSAATAHERLEKRSTIAPATGPSTIDGRKSARRISVIAHGELKRA